MRSSSTDGVFKLLHAQIEDTLEVTTTTFEQWSRHDLEEQKLGNLRLGYKVREAAEKRTFPRGQLSLYGVSVRRFVDDRKSWPKKGGLDLDGFSYVQIQGEHGERSDIERLDWIRRQSPFALQPYEQLATSLQNRGHRREATDVLIAGRNDLRQFGHLNLGQHMSSLILGFVLGHGYRPRRAVLIGLAIILFGAYLFGDGHAAGVVVSGSNGPTDAPFNPFVCSLDAFVPLVDLRQVDTWILKVTEPRGNLLQWYLWIHIGIGWTLTTLTAVGLTGLVRRLT